MISYIRKDMYDADMNGKTYVKLEGSSKRYRKKSTDGVEM